MYGTLSSRVYVLDKPAGHSFGDVEYYKERLRDAAGPVLEPACGSGRMMIPLLEAGIEVEGFDPSAPMLELCRKEAKARGLDPVLFEGTMESAELTCKYQAAIIPAGTLQLLHEPGMIQRAFQQLSGCLLPGGKLIADLYLFTGAEPGLVRFREWEDGEERITLESVTVEVDYLNQKTIDRNRYERWKEGKLIETELELFPLRWLGLEEAALMLREAGFSEIIFSGGYEYGKKPVDASEVITVEAVKA
ncbi:class I SAM-dependent methyltransferase [Alkalicoccus luteus]|nr:class I SAM-dependent methyltransferase [Alkalicoccus luteus]